MGGKAIRTNVAGGMSGSPVYINGKLMGAVALRMSVFSPDAICGITPIELMLEINEFDKSRPDDARTPDKVARTREVSVPSDMLMQAVAAGAAGISRDPDDGPDRIAAGLLGIPRIDAAASSARCSSSWGSRRCRAARRAATCRRPSRRKGWENVAQPGRYRRGRPGERRHERQRRRDRDL